MLSSGEVFGGSGAQIPYFVNLIWVGAVLRLQADRVAPDLRILWNDQRKEQTVTADPYSELGVSRNATEEEIKKQYRKLAAKYHPDKNPGDAKAEARFKSLNSANQVLGDKQKRALYDEFGEQGLRDGFDPNMARAYGRRGPRSGMGGGGGGFPGGINLEDLMGGGGSASIGDLFGDLMGGVGGARRAARRRGEDIGAVVRVDFASAIRGASVSVRVANIAEDVTVRIPPGAGAGDKVRVGGHGSPGVYGAPAGDLVLEIAVSDHPIFERDGLDLSLDLPITVAEAYSGAKVRVPTIDGGVMLTVPAGTQSGQSLRLKGKGVKRQKKTGDLYVTFMIHLPSDDSRGIEQAVKALGEETDMSERDKMAL